MAKVLVLGGGFAGVEAAIHLKKQDLEVTLVSERDYLYLYPISIWIPTGQKRREDVSVALDKIAIKHGFQLIITSVSHFDAVHKRTTLQSGRILEGYDYVVLALGQDKVKHEGIEHTLSICGKPEEATALYEQLDALIVQGSGKIAIGFGANPKDSSAVRGGPAFEVLFNIDTYLKKRKVRDNFTLTFFAPMAKPGQKMGNKALVMMDKMFKMANIHKKVGVQITAFESGAVVFEDGTKVASDLTMFIPAGSGHEIFKTSGLPLSDAGFIVTNEYNEITGFETIYAIGDSAALLGPEWRAKQGHIAEVMAKNIAYNIAMCQQKIVSKQSYIEHLDILCLMDTGNSAALVHRNAKRAKMIPLPLIGHWMKKGWGWYARNSKLGKIPRIPGM